MRKTLHILLGILIISGILHVENAVSQSREELENKKKKNEEEIEEASSLLEETRKSRKINVKQVRLLEKRIDLRNNLINSIQDEIEMINDEIEGKNYLIDQMESDLEELRKDYENIIIHAYRNRGKYSQVMYFFAAENFNQAYKRLRYIQQFTELRKNQAILIKQMQNDMVEEINTLESIKEEKNSLISDKQNENRKLINEKSQKDRMVAGLLRQERQLRQEIREKQRIAEQLSKEIAEIIEAEMRKNSEMNMYRQLTPEEKLISDSFSENKGRLPWPTSRGVITGKFGLHQHAVLRGITIQNNGIDIATVEGAEARAIFEGVVSKIFAILGGNYAVIVRHGNFLTVYQNLIDVTVKKGDKVEVKQKLGTVYTDKESNITELHIEIWHELDKQNPEDWLSKQ
jgi:septal ring factor EnvC (AmiA/AmiB activator)